MAKVLTTAGTVTCAHSGTPTLSGAGLLTVEQKPAVLYSAFPGWTPYKGCTNPSSSGGPCAATAPAPPPAPPTSGRAARLTIGGESVLLDDLQAVSTPPLPGSPLVVAAAQHLLTAE